ncbi:uncharacterized protein [Haliotis asinina]|uniref:uncharacterized protein n=1 Tax=Haliotis asinina TaxID=109174 RepID=UPI00353216A9
MKIVQCSAEHQTNSTVPCRKVQSQGVNGTVLSANTGHCNTGHSTSYSVHVHPWSKKMKDDEEAWMMPILLHLKPEGSEGAETWTRDMDLQRTFTLVHDLFDPNC